MMNWYGGWGVGGWLLMSLIMLAVVALIVVGVVALTRRSNRAAPPPPAARAGEPVDGTIVRAETAFGQHGPRQRGVRSRLGGTGCC